MERGEGEGVGMAGRERRIGSILMQGVGFVVRGWFQSQLLLHLFASHPILVFVLFGQGKATGAGRELFPATYAQGALPIFDFRLASATVISLMSHGVQQPLFHHVPLAQKNDSLNQEEQAE